MRFNRPSHRRSAAVYQRRLRARHRGNRQAPSQAACPWRHSRRETTPRRSRSPEEQRLPRRRAAYLRWTWFLNVGRRQPARWPQPTASTASRHSSRPHRGNSTSSANPQGLNMASTSRGRTTSEGRLKHGLLTNCTHMHGCPGGCCRRSSSSSGRWTISWCASGSRRRKPRAAAVLARNPASCPFRTCWRARAEATAMPQPVTAPRTR